MAGYIFTVSGDNEGFRILKEECLRHGYFTPYTPLIGEKEIINESKRKKRTNVWVATFGDLITLKPGDNIYFLFKRKIYGIGVAVNVGNDCKYDNYLNASAMIPNCRIDPEDYLSTRDSRARWILFFEPSNYFFKKGVDMDDVLRYRPSAFKMLRAFEDRSFIKIDDEENRALKEYLFLVNEEKFVDLDNQIYKFDSTFHDDIAKKNLNKYKMDISKALIDEENKKYVYSEMYLESYLLQCLSNNSVDVFGKWDYCSHQLIASPFKPIKYIDKIDIFGYKFSENYEEQPSLITKYLIIEMKKDTINKEAVEQIMQYVDWVCHEYASGDYSRIMAYVVGIRAVHRLKKVIAESCQRTFISETHPFESKKWDGIKLVQFTKNEKGITFKEIPPEEID